MKKILRVIPGASLLIISMILLLSMENDAWQEVKNQDGVNVSSITERIVEDGVAKEYVILRVENSNTSPVIVHWYLKAWYNGICRSCDVQQPNDYNKKIVLAPGEVLTGFGHDALPELRIFKSFPDNAKVSSLTAYELSDFRVEMN